MKLALISYAKLKGEKHWNLILESVEDVQTYFDASSSVGASQFLDVWQEMKKGHDSSHTVNQRVHQSSVVGAAMTIAIRATEKPVTLVDACAIHDKLLYAKFMNMLKFITVLGQKIRVNSKGGYSAFDDMFQTHEELEIDEKQMREFLIASDDFKCKLSLSKPIIVLENDSIISDELHKKIEYNGLGLNYNDWEPIMNFKFRTENWTFEDFFELFDKAVKNGLHTIIAETTLYQEEQFGRMTKILKKVMQNNPGKTLSVKLLLSAGGDLAQYTNNLPSNLILTLL